MKEDYQKALKKLTLFFLSNPVPFNGQSYKNQKGLGTSDQSLFRLWSESVSDLWHGRVSRKSHFSELKNWMPKHSKKINKCSGIQFLREFCKD